MGWDEMGLIGMGRTEPGPDQFCNGLGMKKIPFIPRTKGKGAGVFPLCPLLIIIIITHHGFVREKNSLACLYLWHRTSEWGGADCVLKESPFFPFSDGLCFVSQAVSYLHHPHLLHHQHSVRLGSEGILSECFVHSVQSILPGQVTINTAATRHCQQIEKSKNQEEEAYMGSR